MELSNHINLADPIIRRALYETGKWSRLIAIISGVFLLLAVLVVGGILLVAPGAMNEAFLENPMLSNQSPSYLVVMSLVSIVLGLFMCILLFRFGKLLKGRGPMQSLANAEINTAFGQLATMLKVYAIFSVLSLVGSLVMLFL